MSTEDGFGACLALLTRASAPRVWSLLVTVFGDLAHRDGDWLSSAVLARITGAIGIRPEAMRVAMHRLRKDGWIESRRAGRAATYRLSRFGQEQSLLARPRIYDMPPVSCHLLIAAPGSARPDQTPDLIWVTPELAVATTEVPGLARCSLPEPWPVWMAERLCPPEALGEAEESARIFREVRARLQDVPPLLAMERAVLRVLVVHRWRRIALKMPYFPDVVLPAGWRMAGCREASGDLLGALVRPGLHELEDAAREALIG